MELNKQSKSKHNIEGKINLNKLERQCKKPFFCLKTFFAMNDQSFFQYVYSTISLKTLLGAQLNYRKINVSNLIFLVEYSSKLVNAWYRRFYLCVVACLWA